MADPTINVTITGGTVAVDIPTSAVVASLATNAAFIKAVAAAMVTAPIVSPPPPPPPVVIPPGTVKRPAVNTGIGFFVSGAKLYDANGIEFRIRGLNKNFDDGPIGYSKSGANAVRYFLYGMDTTAHVANQLASYVSFKQVPIYSMYTFPNGTKSTGNIDPAQLAGGVTYWTALAAILKPYEKYLILNIANEWGPAATATNTVWRDAYIAAIKSIRAAGINCTLMIDAPGFGQDYNALFLHAATVFANDTQKNTIFSFHAYGSVTTMQSAISSVGKGVSTVVTLTSSAATHPLAPGYNGTAATNSWTPVTGVQISGVQGMTQLNGVFPIKANVGGTPGAWTVTVLVDSTAFSAYSGGGSIYDQGHYAAIIPRLATLSAQGLCVVVGEFGPGKNIGPSPTMVTPDQIVSMAEASGLGWLPWAWDNNNLANGASDDNGFSMTTTGPGIYTGQATELTAYGKAMLVWYGKVAKTATVF